MAEKDNRQNLGDDFRPLLGLSSRLPDIAPAPGTVIAQWRLSNGAINDTIKDIVIFAYRMIFTPTTFALAGARDDASMMDRLILEAL
jgi:hypothetical protein